MVNLQYPNSDVGDVLRSTSNLRAKDGEDNSSKGKGEISISKEVPREEEAIPIIEMNCVMNGFSLVPAARTSSSLGTGKTSPHCRRAGVSDDRRFLRENTS